MPIVDENQRVLFKKERNAAKRRSRGAVLLPGSQTPAEDLQLQYNKLLLPSRFRNAQQSQWQIVSLTLLPLARPADLKLSETDAAAPLNLKNL